ncbi:MAG TPA: type II toxin-antitoxin system death-on-curing family toxin [Ktedonobacterales bacterium]
MTEGQPLVYLTVGEVIEFNREILRRAGQSPSVVRDLGLLQSALQRPQNAAYYEGADVITQAALYMVGVALNHPFVDGNKRTGYVAGMTFLLVNGRVNMSPSLNDLQMGVWLEEAVRRVISFDDFVTRLRARLDTL